MNRFVPDALEKKEEIFSALQGEKILLFLDYDGTLTPIVDRPVDAFLSKPMKEILEKCVEAFAAVAVISGRDLQDLMGRVKIDGLYYAGSHGFDISGPGRFRYRYPEGEPFVEMCLAAAQELEEKLKGIQGVIVEKKRYAVAIHYRLADPGQEAVIESCIDEVASHFQGLEKTGGKKIFELRPHLHWNKGDAVKYLFNFLGNGDKCYFPIYIGDDQTDEDALSVVHDIGGIGFVVRQSDYLTYASYSVSDVEALQQLLLALLHRDK